MSIPLALSSSGSWSATEGSAIGSGASNAYAPAYTFYGSSIWICDLRSYQIRVWTRTKGRCRASGLQLDSLGQEGLLALEMDLVLARVQLEPDKLFLTLYMNLLLSLRDQLQSAKLLLLLDQLPILLSSLMLAIEMEGTRVGLDLDIQWMALQLSLELNLCLALGQRQMDLLHLDIQLLPPLRELRSHSLTLDKLQIEP